MLHAIPHSEATPYLYYVLAWPWTHVFGSGEVGIRSLSALAGTVTSSRPTAPAPRFCRAASG